MFVRPIPLHRMLNSILRRLSAPKRLRETEKFLWDWCPKGVEVVNDGHSCWLHYGGMIYSLDYQDPPAPENIPGMTEHLENHKWLMSLAGGVYTRRSILEAWCKKHLPDASVIGASDNDIIYPDETQDRPIYKNPHTQFFVTHNGRFVAHASMKTPLPWLAYELRRKTIALEHGHSIYF